MLKIYISGVNADANPSPGIGLARSLRLAYPNAHIIAVDYVKDRSGYDWPDFDERVVFEQWNLQSVGQFVIENVNSGSFWIPGLDIEAIGLAHSLKNYPVGLLSPTRSAIDICKKPGDIAAKLLNISVPQYQKINTNNLDDINIHYPFWMKGGMYGAVKVESAEELDISRRNLKEIYGVQAMTFFQKHIEGREILIAFAASKGELIDAVFMEKIKLTSIGKVWTGEVSELPENLNARLSEFVKQTKWTGGGELECILDGNGMIWLIDCNPRFPAWIHAATLLGRNIPARLLEKISGVKMEVDISAKPIQGRFTRVVIEIVASERPMSII